MPWLLALALVTVCSQLAVSASESKEKYVSAMVYAKWSETPLLLEAAEFIHKNNPAGFWLFAKDITESSKFDTIESSKSGRGQAACVRSGLADALVVPFRRE